MAKKSTRIQILDCAEELFAEKGIGEVSLREIIGKAGVNLAAVHYHFGSRDELVREVFHRRLKEVNSERLDALEGLRVQFGKDPIPLRELLHAFLAPPFHMGKRDSGGNNFFRIIARAHAETNEVVTKELYLQLQDVLREFMKEFKRTVPTKSDTEQLLHIVFTAGAMVQAVLAPLKLEFAKQFGAREMKNQEILDLLIGFCAAGMEADES